MNWKLGCLGAGIVLLGAAAEAAVLHAKPGADPDNEADVSSWEHATNLQRALAIAQPGDEVWLSEGVYTPDLGQGQTEGNRSGSFRCGRA